MKKVLVYILTYNSENQVEGLLDRIPELFWTKTKYDVEVMIVDDASKDNTADVIRAYSKKHKKPITLLVNPINQGYGGNQKIGYTYAIEENFDAVVMLHGDGQYPPELMEGMIDPLLDSDADAVFGSRMLNKRDALKGGMPKYKFVGNIILTKFQNFLLGSKLAEFHTGYRSYKIDTLKRIPYRCNSSDFDFDTDIIIQLVDSGSKIVEIPIYTTYGDEECNVNGMKYAAQITYSTIMSRVQRYGIYYDPKFDYASAAGSQYESKVDFDSSHSCAIDAVKEGSVVLDIGCGSGHIAAELAKKNCTVYGVDQYSNEQTDKNFTQFFEKDIDSHDFDFPEIKEKIDYILLLDVIEHSSNPELFLRKMRLRYSESNPTVVLTTGNVAFSLVRFSMLFGSFNYGKRGILDLDHKRLFTFRSIKRLLKYQGYKTTSVQGITVPIPLILGDNGFARFCMGINKFFIMISKGMFSYQIMLTAKINPTLDEIMKAGKNAGKK